MKRERERSGVSERGRRGRVEQEKRVLAYFSGDVGIEARKDDRAVSKVLGLARVYDRVSHEGGYRRRLFPICGFGVGFSSRSGRSAEGVDDEPWVVREEGDKTLADCPCGADDADLDGGTVWGYVAHDGGGQRRGGCEWVSDGDKGRRWGLLWIDRPAKARNADLPIWDEQRRRGPSGLRSCQ